MRWIRSCAAAAALLIAAAGWPQDPSSASFFSPNRWALVIGASEYKELGSLAYASSDAELFAKSLQDDYKFAQSNVRLLTDSGNESAKPTSAKIRQQLDEILANPRLDKSDLFVFYFSGHGIAVKGQDMLLPTDAKVADAEKVGLPVNELVRKIVAAGVQNVLIVADACRSGEKNQFGSELIRLGREANIAVVLGCAPGGRSYELPREKHGALTHILVKAMADVGLRDELTGALWASNLAERVRKDVETLTAKEQGKEFAQIPSVWCEKNQDIFLGGFVGRGGVSTAMLEQVMERGEGVTKDVYGRYLIAIANAALEVSEPDIAIRAVRLHQSLGLKDALASAIEAVATDSLGRSHEAEVAFKRLVKEYPDHYTAHLYRTLYSATFAERQKAAYAMWKKFGNFEPAYVWVFSYRRDPATSDETVLAKVDEAMAAFPEGSGPHQFFVMLKTVLTSDPRPWVEKFDFPDLPDVRKEYLEMLVFDVAALTGDPILVVQTIQRIIPRTSFPQTWELLERPWVLAAVTPDNAEAHALALIKNASGPERVWTAFLLLRPVIDKHAATFAEAEKQFPHAWRTQAAAWIAQSVASKTPRLAIPEKLIAAGLDDPGRLAEVCEYITLCTLGDWAAWEGLVTDTWHRQVLTWLCQKPAYGEVQYWRALVVASIVAAREDVMAQQVSAALRQIRNPGPEMAEARCLSLFANGRGAEVRGTLTKLGDPMPITRSVLAEVVAWNALNGRPTEAKSALAELKAMYGDAKPTILEILADLVLASEGKQPSLFDYRLRADVGQLEALLIGLVESCRKNPDVKMMSQCLEAGLAGYQWAHAELMKRYAAAATGKEAESAVYWVIARSEPLYAGITVNGLPEMEPHGDRTMPARVTLGDGMEAEGTLTVKWTGGKATVELTSGTTKLEWRGTVAPNGQVQATGKWNGADCSISLRLLPASYLAGKDTFMGFARIVAADGSFGEVVFTPGGK